jgi:membrane protein involved in colicin uptake
VARLLALVNPFEGFEGAGFALGELFAGDITSIVERFNLSRTAVRDLLNESSSAEEIIAGLTALLADQGITAEVLAARTGTVAQTYQTLGTLANNTFVQIGQSAAAAFEPVANLLNVMLGLNEILATETNVSAATAARTYEQYSAAIDEAAAATDDAGKRIELQNMKLNEAQFTYMQALVMTGVTMESAIDQAQLYGRTWVELTEGAGYYEEQSGALAEAQALLAEATRNAAIQNREQAAAQADAVGTIDTSTLATNALKGALDDATKAMFAAANANLSLDEQAQQAAMALLGAGEAGRLAALQLADSTSNIDKLIARYYNLAAAAETARNTSVVAGMELGLVGPSTPVVAPRTVVTTGGGGGGGGGGTSAARDQADELQRIAERHQESMLRAEETYQERLLRITEDYAKRRRKANQDYSDQQFEDRAGFYRSLMNIEDQAIREQASAEYEALALEATQIRDALGADVAAEYLAEAGRVAAARAQRAEEIRKARQDGDKNLEYLIALDKMEREVEDRRLKRAESGEASIASQEEADRQEAAVQLQQDIKNAADDAGKALLKAQQDANTAIGTTNEALQKQVDLLGQIGGRPTTTTAGTATTSTTATDAAPLATGAAVGTTGIAVYDAVVAQALAGVRDAVNAVERAVSRIPTRSAVGGG